MALAAASSQNRVKARGVVGREARRHLAFFGGLDDFRVNGKVSRGGSEKVREEGLTEKQEEEEVHRC